MAYHLYNSLGFLKLRKIFKFEKYYQLLGQWFLGKSEVKALLKDTKHSLKTSLKLVTTNDPVRI